MKSILNALDIFLGHVAAGIMTFLLYLSLGAVAISSLISIPIDFFEYGADISELALTEIGIFTCLCIVIWRFYRRGKQVCWTWWQMFRRLVFTVSTMALLLSSLALLVIWEEVSNKGRLELEFFTAVDKFETYIFSILVIFVIYAATPLPKLWQKQITEEKPAETPLKQRESIVETDSPMPGREILTATIEQPQVAPTSLHSTDKNTNLSLDLSEGKL